MKECILLVAPPGVGLTTLAPKIAERLGAATEDIEKEIIGDEATIESLKAVKATFDRETLDMETITHNLPRTKVSELWQAAVGRCFNKLSKSGNDLGILSGHLVYYCKRRSEFYSVINPVNLFFTTKENCKETPSRVFLLIDDIYDMYIRLRERRKLYTPEQVQSFYERNCRDMGLAMDTLEPDRLAFLAALWETQNLLHLLSWRCLEMTLAQNLASQLNSRFCVWPVKQLTELLLSQINDPSRTLIYLSHPISEPRRYLKRHNAWPDLVSQVNALPRAFSTKGITLVMPTAIDELRLEVREGKYTSRLSPRWPTRGEREDNTLYMTTGADAQHAELLCPKYWKRDTKNMVNLDSTKCTDTLRSEINASLQVLAGEIGSQIAARDFCHVYNTAGLVVFRPSYAEVPRKGFAKGVEAEMRLWDSIVQLKQEKRIVFVHLEEDVENIIKANRNEVRTEFIETMWSLLYQKFAVKREDIERMVKNKGTFVQQEELLEKVQISQAARESLEKAFAANIEVAKTSLLKKYLTGNIGGSEANVGVLVRKSFVEVLAEIPRVTRFLKTGEPISQNWRDLADKHLPSDSIMG
jgi:hypothetical protein